MLYGEGRALDYGIAENEVLRVKLAKQMAGIWDRAHLVVEMVACYGMPVGREVFDTCVWIGRFIEAWGRPHSTLYRSTVKLHLCGQTRAKDANVRQALIDRFGPGREKAIGTKAKKGPLYGVKADVWQALALAVTFADAGGKR
jgi:hypothetical protein